MTIIRHLFILGTSPFIRSPWRSSVPITCRSRLPRRQNVFCRNGCLKCRWDWLISKGFVRSRATDSNPQLGKTIGKADSFAEVACGSTTALFGLEPMDAQGALLLAPRISESYLSAPRGQYQGASQLAAAAGVSVMSAFRFIEEFSKEGFLDSGQGLLQLERLNELLNRWLAASQRRVSEVPLWWVLHKGKRALPGARRPYQSKEKRPAGDSAGPLPLPRPYVAFLSPHAVADEPVLLWPHMSLSQFIPIPLNLCPNRPNRAQPCLYFSTA